MAMQTGLRASYLKKILMKAGIGYTGWSFVRNGGFSDAASRLSATKKLSTQKTENLDGKLDQDNKSKLIGETMSKSVYNETGTCYNKAVPSIKPRQWFMVDMRWGRMKDNHPKLLTIGLSVTDNCKRII